jgi:Dolichyl-phosphate-mannose-protein mannosyltransferase
VRTLTESSKPFPRAGARRWPDARRRSFFNTSIVRADTATQPGRRLRRHVWPELSAVVVGGAVFNGLLAVPIRSPRIFGDELIYWQLGRAFAWTGHFTVRGGAAPRYGVAYPALLAAAQRIGSNQTSAFALAQGLNAVIFSLTAVPVYFIASRVLRRRYALFAALLAVVLPSCVLTSAIMTENAFYPAFVTSALLMVRALERPSAARQLLVAASTGAAFLVRAQGVVLLPSYLLAAVLLAVTTSRSRRLSALAASLRQQAPTIAVVALAGVAALAIPGRSTLGPYHVLVTSYGWRPLAHWALANLADIELYLGVIPLAAFGILLVQAFSSASASADLRRLVLLTTCLGAGLFATVAALSASPYGLARTHERNLFYLVPLVLIGFFAWLEAGLPRPRGTATMVAIALVLLPLTIPVVALGSSGEDGLALVWWEDRGTPPRHAIAEMVLVAAVAAAVFLLSRRPWVMIGICLAALAVALVAGERHAARAVRAARATWRDAGWIDRAVGPEARVVALWGTTTADLQYSRIEGLWADEFFNRSVRDVASANGPLPDGLPVEKLKIRADGCLDAALPWTPQYAVVEAERPLTAPVVRISPSKRAILYRLDARASDQRCFARLRHR